MRRLLSSLNLVVTLGLLMALFILVNFIASRRYLRHDVSRQHITALSGQTVETLQRLTEPLSVIVFYQPSHRLYELIRDQLKEYERQSPQVKVEYVDPMQDRARADQIVKQFDIRDSDIDVRNPNLLIVRSGSRRKYLSDTDLADYDLASESPMAEPHVKAFKGEAALTSAIINVTQTGSTTVWVTTGHGEKALGEEDPKGLSGFKRLLEQQNFSPASATLLEQSEVPPDVKLIIIPGPARRFAEAEVAMLETYLNRGGRLLALIDPLTDTGLEELLKRWGITVGHNIVVDPARRLPYVSAANLFVTDYTEHPIVSKMKTLMTLFPLARSVTAVQPAPSGITAAPLALTSAAGWGETDTANERFQFNEGADLKGPVSIAMAAERAEPSKARLVVVGDSEFLINAQLENVGNKDLAMGGLYWLVEQEQLIGISPRPVESIKLMLTGAQLRGIFWFSFAGMPLAAGLLGAAVWWTRRQ